MLRGEVLGGGGGRLSGRATPASSHEQVSRPVRSAATDCEVPPGPSTCQGSDTLSREVLRPRASGGEGGRRPDEGALTVAQSDAPHPHSASLRVSLSPLPRGEGCSRQRSVLPLAPSTTSHRPTSPPAAPSAESHRPTTHAQDALSREVLLPRASGGEGGRRPDEGALTVAQSDAPHPHSASLRVSLSPLPRGEGCSRQRSHVGRTLSPTGDAQRRDMPPAPNAASHLPLNRGTHDATH
jgi:hypothetical protein